MRNSIQNSDVTMMSDLFCVNKFSFIYICAPSAGLRRSKKFRLLLLFLSLFTFQMSESETDESESFSKDCSLAESDQDSEVNSDCRVVAIGSAITTPYEDEPILHGENMEESEEEVNIDGILLHVLESRFEKETPLNEW